MMKTIRLISVLAAAAGLIFSYSSCERHSYEETSKLRHHGDHGDDQHDGEAGHDADQGAEKDHKKGDHAEGDPKEEKGRKVF